MPTIKTLRAADPAGLAAWTAQLEASPMAFAETVDCDSYLLALNEDDADQLAAALALGLIPSLLIHARSQQIFPGAYDWYNGGWAPPPDDDADQDDASHPDDANPPPPREHYLAGEVADAIFDPARAGVLEFPRIVEVS